MRPTHSVVRTRLSAGSDHEGGELIASEFGSTLQGVGTLITGLAAIGALVRSHQGATKAKVAATEATAAKGIATDTNHVIKDTVVPALTNHENLTNPWPPWLGGRRSEAGWLP